MNTKEASIYLGISKKAINRYVQEGRLNAVKIRNKYQFKKSDLDQFKEKIRHPDDTKGYCSKKTASYLLGLCKLTIERMVKNKSLQAYKNEIGLVCISLDSINEILERRKIANPVWINVDGSC